MLLQRCPDICINRYPSLLCTPKESKDIYFVIIIIKFNIIKGRRFAELPLNIVL